MMHKTKRDTIHTGKIQHEHIRGAYGMLLSPRIEKKHERTVRCLIPFLVAQSNACSYRVKTTIQLWV